MVNRIHWREQNAVMAVLADIGGRDMRRRFANRLGAVVAADAIAGNIDVIEIGRDPAIRCVAIVAGVPAGYVRWGLAHSYRAVVTG